MKNNRAAVKKVVALMLRICDIHNLKETMAELSDDAWGKKRYPSNIQKTQNYCQNAPNWDSMTSGNKSWTVSNLKSFLQMLHSMK